MDAPTSGARTTRTIAGEEPGAYVRSLRAATEGEPS